MVMYNENKTVAYFNGQKFRRDAKTGYFLSTKPTNEGKRERLHVYVWRYYNGPIQNGYHVHHIDENKYHNDIDNLICLDKSLHLSKHQKERAKSNHEEITKNLKENAAPAAAAWHKSEAGKEWHRKHWQENLGKRTYREFVCKCCGNRFSSLNVNSKFCSNSCKTKARSNSGVDNESRKCEICGREFICNKYIARKTCSEECRVKLFKSKKNTTMRNGAGL